MRKLRQASAVIAVAAAATIVATTVPALADPPTGAGGKQVVPQSYDVVGVGADTDQFLFDQLSVDYNKTVPVKKHGPNHPFFYSWDATKPGSTSSAPTTIVSKAGCTAATRPNGGNAGLKALDQNTFDGKTGHYCIDFARTSSGRSSTAPAPRPGGVLYVALAEDAVTYTSRDTGPTDVPKTLTTAQLKNIFLCNDTNWDQVGGPNAPIKAYVPQSGSGTLTFWLKVLNITAAGSCVNETLEENQGLSSQFNSPNAIFIYSVADWIAQKYHSAACNKKPTASQNHFGCNQTGFLGLNKINGVSPVTTAKIPTINRAFKSTGFTRTIYDILRWTGETPDHILSRLEPFFSAKARHGYVCSNATAIKDIQNYGFLTIATCGSGS